MDENEIKILDNLIEIHGLEGGGTISDTLTSIYYLTFGYFFDYKKHLFYKQILNHISKK
jgi:hypothetical protein